MSPSHQHLLERVRASDMEAFKELFEEFQPVLFRHTVYRVRDEDLSHDIVQATFVKVWEHRHSLKPHLPFLPYLLRISGNLIRDHADHVNVRVRLEADVPLPARSVGDDPEETLYFNTLEQEITRVVNTKLPARCREVFLMSRIEGKSNGEIAELLGVSIKTVENQLTHALKVLRRELARYL